MRALQSHFSRATSIQGDDSFVASKFGGHVMIMGASAAVRETNPAIAAAILRPD
jgi:hypothetical protein